MRPAVLLFALLVHASCQSCPDSDAEGSLFCHAASCATNESVCAGACSNLQADRDNCGSCGNRCGDGLVCSLGQCVEGCDNGLAACAGNCVDFATDESNCGGCGATSSQYECTPDQTCNNGVCGCGPDEIVCGGVCTDPKTSQNYCGATGTCTGANDGTMCTNDETCLNGVCTAKFIYRGSLPATTGRWTYMGMLGIAGANADCAAHWPGTAICTYSKLLAASMKPTPETINATDYNNVPVTTWWIDDPQAAASQRCRNNADGIPWSYATADQGNVGKSVVLTPATGAISALQTDTLPSCNQSRFVPCCSLVTGP